MVIDKAIRQSSVNVKRRPCPRRCSAVLGTQEWLADAHLLRESPSAFPLRAPRGGCDWRCPLGCQVFSRHRRLGIRALQTANPEFSPRTASEDARLAPRARIASTHSACQPDAPGRTGLLHQPLPRRACPDAPATRAPDATAAQLDDREFPCRILQPNDPSQHPFIPFHDVHAAHTLR